MEDQPELRVQRLEALSELSSICGGGVFVSINNHPEFHQSTGNLMLTATKVMEMCANAGVVVTDNDLMWKQVSGLTDSNYRCAGDSKLFYVLQKRLIVEMIMDVLTLDAQTGRCMCGRVPAAIQCAGGNVRYHYKPDFTAHFINKQKKHHEEQRREGKALGREDGDDMRTKWYYFDDVADLLCAQCHAEGAQSTADHHHNANSCINCHANGLIEQNTMYKAPDRPL